MKKVSNSQLNSSYRNRAGVLNSVMITALNFDAKNVERLE